MLSAAPLLPMERTDAKLAMERRDAKLPTLRTDTALAMLNALAQLRTDDRRFARLQVCTPGVDRIVLCRQIQSSGRISSR
jgi:hypothetical protein